MLRKKKTRREEVDRWMDGFAIGFAAGAILVVIFISIL